MESNITVRLLRQCIFLNISLQHYFKSFDTWKKNHTLHIRDLKQHDAFNKTWWSVLSIDESVTYQHISIERSGHHVVLKTLPCLRSLFILA